MPISITVSRHTYVQWEGVWGLGVSPAVDSVVWALWPSCCFWQTRVLGSVASRGQIAHPGHLKKHTLEIVNTPRGCLNTIHLKDRYFKASIVKEGHLISYDLFAWWISWYRNFKNILLDFDQHSSWVIWIVFIEEKLTARWITCIIYHNGKPGIKWFHSFYKMYIKRCFFLKITVMSTNYNINT